jgi:hypothetical protein
VLLLLECKHVGGESITNTAQQSGAQSTSRSGTSAWCRDQAAVFEVLGQIDRGHAALPELTLDPVTVGVDHRQEDRFASPWRWA